MPITLQKAQETAGIHLQKSGVDTASLPTIRVGLCLDVSGSMHHEYRDGHVQEAVTHLLGLANHMDKSGRMDVFTFENEASQCRYPATPDNYASYVREHILDDPSVDKWGGTDYSPVIHLAYQHYFPHLTHLHSHEAAHSHLTGRGGHSGHGFLGRLFHRQEQEVASAPVSAPVTQEVPTLMLFLTDGDASDEHKARTAVHAAADLPLFWVFVGLAHNSNFLRALSDEADAEFVLLEDGVRVSDDRLYRSLITPKLVRWLQHFSGAGIR